MKARPPYYKPHHDDEFTDEIRLKVVPRYKTSGISGNEWRSSVRIEFVRKGRVFATETASTMHYALLLLGTYYLKAHEPVPQEALDHAKGKCDQPGCPDDAVNHFKKRVERLGGSGETIAVDAHDKEREVRSKYCRRHSQRGDSDREDNDRNLTLVKGKGVVEVHDEDESAARTEAISVKDPEDLPAALEALRKRNKSS